ncbi:hypothetical protein [Branchiibius cervicis]|uniref:Uncharacterized protein n=1 Tax=Branchiibius cervicis TaxID=908252 RepID=A0ABW2ARH5_9MICO
MIWPRMGFIMVTSAFRKGDFPAPEMLPNTDPEVVAIDVNDLVRRAADPRRGERNGFCMSWKVASDLSVEDPDSA